MRIFLVLIVALLWVPIALVAQAGSGVPPTDQTILDAITAGNLKADLSFLASDALQGRYTPSPGLDIAAEFIAAQFRGAGLQPGGNDGYFQTADMIDRKEPEPAAALILHEGTKTFTVAPKSYVIFNSSRHVVITHARVAIFPNRNIAALKQSDVTGEAVIVRQPDFHTLGREKAGEAYANMMAFDQLVNASRAAIEIVVTDDVPHRMGSRLFEAAESDEKKFPVILVRDAVLDQWLEHSAGKVLKTVSVSVPAPRDEKAVVKNVIGILRGSDSQLGDTAVLLTAHYDHIGTGATADRMAMKKPEPGDQIYNGADDDGSGTVSVIEIAKALAALNPHPKRSIVFMTFFGEERGELGSQYYVKHPVFPMGKTVADVNLEQVGRTDEVLGGKLKPQINTASVTGYDYSDVTKFLEDAGRQTGVKLYKNDQASDQFFAESDNESFAREGVPAHSLCVAFEFPDYHAVGDEWQKIDYENMAHIDRMVALAVTNMANSEKAPSWNAQNPSAAPFRQARSQSRSE